MDNTVVANDYDYKDVEPRPAVGHLLQAEF